MSMLTQIEPRKRKRLAGFFANHRPSFIIDCVLEGHLGTTIADDEKEPTVVQLAFADVVVLAGDSGHPVALELVKRLPENKIILPSPPGWSDLLAQVHGNGLKKLRRFAFSGKVLDLDHLRPLAGNLPEGYRIERIDIELARRIYADPSIISEDHVRNFNSPECFVERGIGFCALRRDRIVCGASSYAFCDKGIEVQVNTHPDFRGRGLATAVSAALLTYCLDHGIEPHWDTGNEISLRLAEKLGYVQTNSYEVLLLERSCIPDRNTKAAPDS
jgi:GNAT superfamily N-acetyltransferase